MKYAKRFANRRTRFVLWLALRLIRSDEHRARLAMAVLDELTLANVRNCVAYATVIEMHTVAGAPAPVVDDSHQP